MISSRVFPFRVLALCLALALLSAGCSTTPRRATSPPSAPKKHIGAPIATAQWLAAAESAERNGDDEQALLMYVNAATDDPRNAELHYRVGRIQAGRGNAGPASDAFRRALALSPTHAGALEGMGLLLLKSGKNGPARKLLESALKQEPTRWRTLNGMGILADLDGDSASAMHYFRRAIAQQPSRAELLNNIGYSYYLANQITAAQHYFERATTVAPARRTGWSNLGLVYARQAQYPEAVRALERIMSPAEARYATAYVCLLDARIDDAVPLLEEAVRLSPAYFEAAELALKQVSDRNRPVRSPRID
jgi:Tfp pilus assembly protein PilF